MNEEYFIIKILILKLIDMEEIIGIGKIKQILMIFMGGYFHVVFQNLNI